MNLLLLTGIKTSNIDKVLKSGELAKAKIMIITEYLTINFLKNSLLPFKTKQKKVRLHNKYIY